MGVRFRCPARSPRDPNVTTTHSSRLRLVLASRDCKALKKSCASPVKWNRNLISPELWRGYLYLTLLRGDRDVQRALQNKYRNTGMLSVDLLDAFICWYVECPKLNISISCLPNHVWSYFWTNLRPFTTVVDEFVLHKREMFASNILKLYFEERSVFVAGDRRQRRKP